MKTQVIKFSTVAVLFFAFLISGNVHAQSKGKEKKTQTIEIKSSVVCGDCEERVLSNLAFEKGVKDVKVDLKTKIITVTYKTGKTDKETIKKAITKIGYDADEMLADQDAYDKLPACCKKDAPPH